MTADEARAAPNMVPRIFLVNGMTVNVLLDSGSTRSFMPLVLSKRFSDTLGTLDYLLEVEILDEILVSTSRVHRWCVLNMFSERYSIDLVPIPMRRLKVIVDMGWLGPNGVMIDYKHQLVRFRTLCGGRRLWMSFPSFGNSPMCFPRICLECLLRGRLSFRLI